MARQTVELFTDRFVRAFCAIHLPSQTGTVFPCSWGELIVVLQGQIRTVTLAPRYCCKDSPKWLIMEKYSFSALIPKEQGRICQLLTKWTSVLQLNKEVITLLWFLKRLIENILLSKNHFYTSDFSYSLSSHQIRICLQYATNSIV